MKIIATLMRVALMLGPLLGAAHAQGRKDADLVNPHEVLTVKRDGYTISALGSGKPLLTVRGGGNWRGDRCEAFTAHGYRGVERETVEAMRQWVKTGAAPAEVAR